ncbi:TIGR03747 family integrating conjugative element membrane protein [Carnimonas bestiolae]|uniref:TIGR03747 family integrating conjugative element membrane protein n=1 Tax=Carnimonas bestiolae TaxID=3402172 RepID=UPI003EDC0C50
MASSSDAPARRAEHKSLGLLGFLLKLPFTVAWIVIVSILTSIVVEWIGIYFGWWSQPGSEHARQTMISEMGYLDSQFTRSILVASPADFANDVINTINDWAFVKTGITSWVEGLQASTGWFGSIADYAQSVVYVTLMTLTRCMILLLTSPLFLLVAIVGFIDGLVRRDLRRFGAGRESATVYHHAKRMISPIFVFGWLIYLSLPLSIHPNLFLLPCALIFGLMVSITTGSYKKYL